MRRATLRLGTWLTALSMGLPAWADDYQLDWSSTFEVRLDDFESSANDDDVTGFFDLYEFTKNKEEDPAVQVGLTDFSLDLFGPRDTPRLQVRLDSPTSNLGLGGNTALSRYFLNQRGEVRGRLSGARFDLDYRRLRTDELRLFPNPTGVGGDMASSFTDTTSPTQRFFTRRTGIGGELRLRPGELIDGPAPGWAQILSEVKLRGGYGERKGKRQVRSLIDSIWTGATTRLDQEVTRGGGGVVLRPISAVTLALDVDHERFREQAAPLLEGLAPVQTIVFLPDTDRTTGRVRLNARLGERAVIHGGFQASSLEQVGTRTPTQLGAGLGGNKIRFYSGNLASDVTISESVSANAYVKFDQRNNRIPNGTPFFSPANATQIVPFLDRVRWFKAGAELVYRMRRMNQVAAGFRGEWTNRDLDFAAPFGFLGGAILPSSAVIKDDTERYSGYLRSQLRPLRGLQLSSEVGFFLSPETGYIRELEEGVYGEMRGSYSLPLSRPVTLSVFGRGESGRNDDFSQVGETLGPVNRNFDRTKFSFGSTLTASPHRVVTLIGSVFHYRDAQDFPFVRSNDLLELQPSPFIDIDFMRDQGLDYRSDLTVAVAGANLRFSKRTDAALAYSFTRSEVRLLSNGAAATTIADASRIRSDIHRVDLELGHWFTEGVRGTTSYRYQKYRDLAPVMGAGVVAPFDLGADQHTVAIGLTLTSDLLR